MILSFPTSCTASLFLKGFKVKIYFQEESNDFVVVSALTIPSGAM